MRYLILLIGVFCCSTSVIFIKIGETDPVVLSGYRTLLGGCLMIPFLFQLRRMERPPLAQIFKRAWPPAFFLAVHFITWIMGARLTPSANASLIVNMVPVVMPILLFFVIRERITRAEGVGTTLAILGVIALGIGDFSFSREHALGDAVCFISMLFYAFYLIFARKNRDLASIYLYVIPVYILSGLICLALAGGLSLSGKEIVWVGPNLQMETISIIGLAVVPTIFGHSIINWALRTLRGQVVVIINLAQFTFAGIMGFFLLGELPHFVFYLASILVVAGAVIVIRHSPSSSS